MRKHDPPEVSSGGFFNAPIEVTKEQDRWIAKILRNACGTF
jgi:hypothetical protein